MCPEATTSKIGLDEQSSGCSQGRTQRRRLSEGGQQLRRSKNIIRITGDGLKSTCKSKRMREGNVGEGEYSCCPAYSHQKCSNRHLERAENAAVEAQEDRRKRASSAAMGEKTHPLGTKKHTVYSAVQPAKQCPPRRARGRHQVCGRPGTHPKGCFSQENTPITVVVRL